MNNQYMSIALKEAKKAYALGDIPVGAVIVKDNKVVAKAYNKKNKTKDPTNHAEILAIKKACKKLGDFRLEGSSMYITLEPCVMCMGAILNARISKVVFGAYDKESGYVQSNGQLFSGPTLNHKCKFEGGVEAEKCSKILQDFFKSKRRK